MICTMSDKIKKLALIHPFSLIDLAWQDYLKKTSFFTRLVLPPTLFYLLLDTLSYVSLHGVSGHPLVVFAQIIERTVPLTILLYSIALILQTFTTAALLSAITDTKITTVHGAYQVGSKKILSLWWVTILSFLIVGGGFLLFVIPGILFSVWFTFSQYVLFTEKKKGMDALLTSREYVRGYFWQIAIRIIFIALIAAALSSIAGYISLLFQNGLVSQIAQSIVSLITIPLVMLFQYKLYENVRSATPDITIKQKTWWMYLIGSLIPFVLIICAITAAVFIKPMRVSGDAMLPVYKNNAFILWGTFPVSNFPSSEPLVYKKNNELTIRRVFAGPGDTIEKKGNTLVRHGKNSPVPPAMRPANPLLVELSLSRFSPPFSILGDKNTYVLKNDEYLMVADTMQSVTPNWEMVKKEQVVGEPYFCLWNCTGKE